MAHHQGCAISNLDPSPTPTHSSSHPPRSIPSLPHRRRRDPHTASSLPQLTPAASSLPSSSLPPQAPPHPSTSLSHNPLSLPGHISAATGAGRFRRSPATPATPQHRPELASLCWIFPLAGFAAPGLQRSAATLPLGFRGRRRLHRRHGSGDPSPTSTAPPHGAQPPSSSPPSLAPTPPTASLTTHLPHVQSEIQMATELMADLPSGSFSPSPQSGVNPLLSSLPCKFPQQPGK